MRSSTQTPVNCGPSWSRPRASMPSCGERGDDRVLHRADVGGDVGGVHDRVADELARAVVGELAAARGLDDVDPAGAPEAGAEREVVRVRAAAERVDGRVLEQEQEIGELVRDHALAEVLLQRGRLAVLDGPEVAGPEVHRLPWYVGGGSGARRALRGAGSAAPRRRTSVSRAYTGCCPTFGVIARARPSEPSPQCPPFAGAPRNVRRYAVGDVPTTRPKCCRSATAPPNPHARRHLVDRAVGALEQPLRLRHPPGDQPLQRRRAGLGPEAAGERARAVAGVSRHLLDGQRLGEPLVHPRPRRRRGRRRPPGAGARRTAPDRRRGARRRPSGGRSRSRPRRRGRAARCAGRDRRRPRRRRTSARRPRRRRARPGRRRTRGNSRASRAA